MRALKCFLFFFSFSYLASHAIVAPFVLEEPNTAARNNEGVIASVPFQKGEVTTLSQLSLHGPSGEAAAQFDALSRYEDGSYKWVLASFLATLGKNGSQSFTVRTQSPSAVPPAAISVSRSGSVVTINTGVVRFQIDTVNFTGIDSLHYQNTPVFGGKTGGLFLDSYTDNQLYANGPVTHAGAVYEGPIRVTYRVQGNFMKPACGGVGYSFMITAYAGSDRLRIDVSVRNSINENCGNYHQIRRCYLKLPLLFTPAAETAYLNKSDTTGLAQPEIKCFSNSSLGVTAHENWGGGHYRGATELGANDRPTGTFQYHNIEQSGNSLIVDVIVEQDSTRPHHRYAMGYEDGPYFWMIDGAHKNSDIFLSFGGGAKNEAALAAEYALNRNVLLGRPDPHYVSSIGAYGVNHRFGTLDDEKAMWTKFGGNIAGAEYQIVPRSADYQPILSPGTSVHTDQEEDQCEQRLLMWLRTGQRGYLDQAEGWARYLMTNWTVHTDGFDYDGFDHVVNAIRSVSTRTVEKLSGFNGPKAQSGRTHDGPYNSGWAGCHFGGQGIIDYYCLTGDPEALEAAHDLGEYAWVQSWYHSSRQTPSRPLDPFTITDSDPAGSIKETTRNATRPFRYLITYVNQLRRPDRLWMDRMTYAAKSWLRAWNRDPRGFVFDGSGYLEGWQKSSLLDTANFPQALKNYVAENNISLVAVDNRSDSRLGSFEGHGTPWIFQIAVEKVRSPGDTLRWFAKGDDIYWTYRMPQPMDLYYEVTGDEDARDYVMAYGQFLSLSGLAPDTCGFASKNKFDFPEPGMSVNSDYAQWNPAIHSVCWGADCFSNTAGVLPEHNSAYSCYYPSVMALGYKYTGDRRILDKTFRTWNLNIKRDYKGTTTQSRYRIDEHTPRYGYLNMDHWNTVGDRITGGLVLFYEAARRVQDQEAPEAVTDLSAVHAVDRPGGLYVSFTAPADRGGGEVAEYQIKYDTVPIVEYDQFHYAEDYIFPARGIRKSPWWYARNVQGEAGPRPAGEGVLSTVDPGLDPSLIYFVTVRTRDRTGNLSPLSNVFRLTPDMIASETGVGREIATALDCYPNPSNPSVVIRYSLPKPAVPIIRVFDTAGRLVRDLSPLRAATSGRIHWNGKDGRGRSVGSGVYFARMVSSDGHIKQIRMVMVK